MQDNDFLLISHPDIWAVPVQECHEPLVDLTSLGFQASLNRASYYAGYTQVRLSIAQKLLEASQYLPQGLRFLLSEGHRPIHLQAQMYKEYYTHLASTYPDWDAHRLKNETVKFIAPPDDVPPHSTGGAIDLTLMDDKGVELDMGALLDELPDNNENKNFTYAKNIPEYAQRHRAILINALSRAGFINYPAEWWHWSYGDKYWAYHAKQPFAKYGSI